MPDWLPPSNEEIEHEAYLLWAADGRPFGRDYEYWMRASGVLSERAQRAAEEARAAAEAARHAALAAFELSWPHGEAEKPTKLVKPPRRKRLPRLRGPATRSVRVEAGKTA